MTKHGFNINHIQSTGNKTLFMALIPGQIRQTRLFVTFVGNTDSSSTTAENWLKMHKNKCMINNRQLHRVTKTSHLWLAITLMHMNGF